MTIKKVNVMGMELDEWRHLGCVAHFGVAEKYATLYDIETEKDGQGRGWATRLLKDAKQYYENQDKEFGSSVALNDTMSYILNKLGIAEYK